LAASPGEWEERGYTAEERLKAPRGAIFETRLEAAEVLRLLGNGRYEGGDREGALRAYRRAFWHVDFDLGYVQLEMTDFHQKQVFEAQAPCRLNVARCVLLEDSAEAKHQAEAVLEAAKICQDFDTKWRVKALYWRAKALVTAGRYDDAEADLVQAAKLDPTDRLLRGALKDVKQQRHDLKKQQRHLYDGKLGPVAPPPERRCLIS